MYRVSSPRDLPPRFTIETTFYNHFLEINKRADPYHIHLKNQSLVIAQFLISIYIFRSIMNTGETSANTIPHTVFKQITSDAKYIMCKISNVWRRKSKFLPKSTLADKINSLKIDLKEKERCQQQLMGFIQKHPELNAIFLREYKNNARYVSEPNLTEIEGVPEDLLYQKRVLERSLILAYHFLNEFFYFLRNLPDLQSSFFSHLKDEQVSIRLAIENILPDDLKDL